MVQENLVSIVTQDSEYTKDAISGKIHVYIIMWLHVATL